MVANVQKWGNSLALRIPKSMAAELGIAAGSEVRLNTEGDRLVVRPSAPSYRLEDLVKGITRKNLHGETDTGPAVGGEAW